MRTAFLLLLSIAATPVVAQTVFEPIEYFGKDGNITLSGEGIALPPGHLVRPLRDSQGNVVRWSAKRDDTDSLGMRHQFFVQQVHAPWGVATIDGTEIRLHYDIKRNLILAGGDQATTLTLQNLPAFNAEAATGHAVAALRTKAPAGIRPGTYRAMASAELVVYRAQKASRVAYQLDVIDEQQLAYTLLLDASTAEPVRATPRFAHSNCAPESSSTTGASAEAVRPGLTPTNVVATPAYRGWGAFEYEAHRPAYANSNSDPAVRVFEQVDPTDSYSCDERRADDAFTLAPVRKDTNNLPRYADNAGDTFSGRKAGAGLQHSIQTMEAFKQLGRSYGWGKTLSGQPQPATILIDGYNFAAGNATWIDYLATNAPPNSVVIARKGTRHQYDLESALDVIGHEFGHAVVYQTGLQAFYAVPTPEDPNYDWDTRPHGAELHEGFADVIGHIVEKVKQPSFEYGTCPEADCPGNSKDWKIGEDAYNNGGFERRADQDSTTAQYHRWDAAFTEGYYERSHMMQVAFRALVDGEKNPYCLANPSQYGCQHDATGIGIQKAGAMMLRAIEFYVGSTTKWTDIATILRRSAFDLYNTCSMNGGFADFEQSDVQYAFYQIGYPSPTYFSCQ